MSSRSLNIGFSISRYLAAMPSPRLCIEEVIAGYAGQGAKLLTSRPWTAGIWGKRKWHGVQLAQLWSHEDPVTQEKFETT